MRCRPLRCLIVEDQLMVLQLLRSMLQAMPGLEISAVASNRAEALAVCDADPPDLLILDLSLPDGDGLTVAEALADRNPEAQMVVLSGQASSTTPTEPLTPRQRQIYALIGQGLSNKEIAKATDLSLATVETHRKAIAQKLGISGAELIRQAALLGGLELKP